MCELPQLNSGTFQVCPHSRQPHPARAAQTSSVPLAASPQVHALHALLDEYSIKLPDVDRAGYATMDSTYAALKALVEEVEGNKDASISKYGAELDTGGVQRLGLSARHLCCCTPSKALPCAALRSAAGMLTALCTIAECLPRC